MRLLLNGIIGLATLLYPFAVYFGTRYAEPWQIATALCVLLLLRLIASDARQQWNRLLFIAGMIYCGFAMWSNQKISLLYYPALVNAVMLVLFSWSLAYPPSVIERIARLQHPDLPPEGVIYTRRVTQVWCGFFIVNGSIALATAVWASVELWSLYNGFIAYLLMALLFGVEYLIRIKTQQHVR
jgi:uncharacterized membrane protein